MRSRAARVTLSATAWIVLGAASYFLVITEQQIAIRRSSLRAFDLRASETASALSDARAGQQAYVAAGQSPAFWLPKVSTLIQDGADSVDALRASAMGDETRRALLEASQATAEFTNIDKRVRDYLRDAETVMAGDVAFSEGGDAAGRAALAVETARRAEHQAFETYETGQRRLEAYGAGGAVGITVLILALLGFARAPERRIDVGEPAERPTDSIEELPLKETTWLDRTNTKTSEPDRASESALQQAADLCTEFGRMRDQADLKIMLGRSARLLNASGLVVWLGDTAGADLKPVMAHGYSDQVLALMRAVPRGADNAAAAAYRSAQLQIVASRPGALGAVVAPLLSADGCIGALTAEIGDAGEASARIQALASILAAQLAGVLAPALPATSDIARTASA